MRALLLRRRGTGAHTPHALSTAEGIIAGLVAGTSILSYSSLNTQMICPVLSPCLPDWRVNRRVCLLIWAGSITTMTTNPIWTVQTAQSTRSTLAPSSSDGAKTKKIKPTALQAARAIYEQDGIQGFWRGIGPALILVINPVIQVRPRTLYKIPYYMFSSPPPPFSPGGSQLKLHSSHVVDSI